MKPKKLEWVCFDCGIKNGHKEPPEVDLCTWHMAVCDICGQYTSVTEPRDFGITKLWTKEITND